MRRAYLFFLFFAGYFSAAAQANIDVLHYKFNIILNDANDTIYGRAEILFISLKTSGKFEFDLSGTDRDNKGMTITMTSVSPAVPVKNVEVSGYSLFSGKLTIKSFKEFSAGDTVLAIVQYKGIPSDGLIISKNKYGDRTFFADNWPNRAHHWIPCIDDPADKASFEFIVTAPAHYRVVSNGTMTEEKEIGGDKKLTHWKEETPLSTKVMVIGVANFAVKTYADSPEKIPVSAWVYQQDSLPGFKNYSVAPSIVKFLSAYIGPYPYEKLANVQSKTIFGGMENASAIFYEETSASLFQNVESLLAHEIAHQWFGDMASEKSFPHLWLSEGFATYLTHIYIESKYGTDSLNKEMKNDRDEIIEFVRDSKNPVVDSVSPLMQLLNANSYQKGGWILHMLRRQLGDSVFHSIIRNYYAAYAGKNADTKDFQKIGERISGKNLETFFHQWLYQPGIPKLEIKWSYDAKRKNLLLTIIQLQKNLFEFPLDILVETTVEKQKKTFIIGQKTQRFRIAIKSKPIKLVADPETSLLFEGSVQNGR